MGQEVSISYQAVKSRVYRLIDALVEGAKTEEDVQESVRRWWNLVHPADRPMAQKYLLAVLEKSNASLGAISDSLGQLKQVASLHVSDKASKMHSEATHTHAAADAMASVGFRSVQ
jgi:hypothetical protein